ncbi:MAG: matrixin family metalloprotease [Chloroflexi bacterium]|nr:matrixin family metalloprotease [Chloroflexota bacterium]
MGSRTFTNPSYTKYSDGECGSVRTRNQIFNFDSSSNPLRAGSRVKVTLTLNGSGGGANPTPTITPTPTATSTQSPTGSASLSPDPSTVSFQPDGRWHRFTVNSGGTVRVYTNPGTTPLNVEVFTSNTGNHCSNGAEREYKSRSNGQSVYLAGCNSGTGTVQLQTSSGTVIRTYTFTIGSGGGANPTPTHTATPTHTPTATHTPTTATSGCVPQALGAAADVVLKGYWSGASNRCGTSLAVACVPYSLFIVYPHFNRQQTFWFEHEPAIGSTRVEWTNDFSVTRRNPRQFLYMPILMAHEFGHAAGLWHSPGSSDAMFHAARTPRQNISGNDKNAMKAIYNHHAAH